MTTKTKRITDRETVDLAFPPGGRAMSDKHAWVISPRGDTALPVKNLGWLLRHAEMVDRFDVTEDSLAPGFDCTMFAYLRDGRVFMCDWQSRNVLLDWIHRPSFRGLPVNYFGSERVA